VNAEKWDMFCEFDHKILNTKGIDLAGRAFDTFHFQYRYNGLYRQFVDSLYTDVSSIKLVEQIPFLPISFFKSQDVRTTLFKTDLVFESSGTTGSVNSKHSVKDPDIYRQSFLNGFELFYGQPSDYCVLGLLPSYLERKNSSLVYMVDELIRQSGHPKSGFYLNEFDKLDQVLSQLEKAGQRTILIGVSFALIDFSERFPRKLKHTIIMETGGMKGRRKELTREELHDQLRQAFGVDVIHSEYGMTELLSQAYSKANGIFQCPPWMKVLVRDEDDPLLVHNNRKTQQTGIINIIDLANIYSSSFIATDDLGRLYPDGSFEVLGRVDNSDIRGCSLLTP